MNFRIADTFTSSIARLTGDEQKAVKLSITHISTPFEAPKVRSPNQSAGR